MKSIGPSVTLMLVAFACPGIVAQKPAPKEQIKTDVLTVLVSPADQKEIRQLMDLQGQTPGNPQMAGSLVDQVVSNYRTEMTQVPPNVWQELTVSLKSEFSPDRVAQSLMSIYATSFTQAEVRELIKFFSSPVGRKWAEQLPKLQQSSYNTGYSIGVLLGERIRERLKAKGYTLPTR